MSINAVELRPRSAGEVLRLSLDLYRRNFPLFIGIAAVVLVPILLLTSIGSIGQMLPLMQVAAMPATSSSDDIIAGTFVAFSLVTWCLSGIALVLGIFWPWMEGALTFNVIERVLGRAPGVRQSYRETRPRWGALWGSNALAQLGINAPWVIFYILFLFALVIAGAASSAGSQNDASVLVGVLAVLCIPVFIAGIIIMIVLAINWTFRAPVVVGEGADGVAALGRSTALAKGDRWRILGRYVLLALVELVLIGLPVLVASTMVTLIMLPNLDSAMNIDRAALPAFTLFSVLAVAVSFFGTLLLTPLRIIYNAINYIDLRARKENLAQAVAGLTATPAPDAAMPAATEPAKIGIGIPAKVDMATLSPGQRIGVLFNRIRNEGESPALLNELGLAYMEIGDQGGAADAFARARELAPNDADVVYNLMALSMQRRDMHGARQLMRDYLQLETNAADVERVRNDPRFKDVLPD